MPMTFEQWSAANKEAGGEGSKYGYEKHMKSIGQPIAEDEGRQERVDFARQNIDSTISEEQWKINDYAFNPDCPPKYPYNSDDGQGCAEKPQNSTQVVKDASGNWGPKPGGDRGGQGRGGGGGLAGPPPPPPKPTTFGKQLSYTGNPMQDMLIQQFNARTNAQDPSQANIFGMGLDRAVGGEGASADAPQMAQALSGGGLWRGSEETFGGFRADQSNVTQPKVAKPRRRGRGRGRGRGGAEASVAPAAIAEAPGAATATPAPTPAQPNMPSFKLDQFETGVPKMLRDKYGGQASGYNSGAF